MLGIEGKNKMADYNVTDARNRRKTYKKGGKVRGKGNMSGGPRSEAAGKADKERYKKYKEGMKAKGKTGIGMEEYLHSEDEKWFAGQPKLRKEIKRRKKIARAKGIKFQDIP